MAFFVVSIVMGVFVLIPAITFPPEAFSTHLDIVFDVLSTVFYVLPAETIFTIFGIVISLHCTRIAISFVKMIWDLLPIV